MVDVPESKRSAQAGPLCGGGCRLDGQLGYVLKGNEVAKGLKCLPHKYEDPSLAPREKVESGSVCLQSEPWVRLKQKGSWGSLASQSS